MCTGKQIQSMVVNGKTSAKIEGLRPYTEYAISIRGYASNSGAGPKSDLIKARTLPSSKFKSSSHESHSLSCKSSKSRVICLQVKVSFLQVSKSNVSLFEVSIPQSHEL